MEYPEALERLVQDLRRLPGIGRKSAERAAFSVLEMDEEDVRTFAEDLVEARTQIHRCRVCGNITQDEVCAVCADPRRDHSVICVVRDVQDVLALEKTNEYRGTYHVLHGSISPMDGVGPDDLTINELLARLDGSVEEVILATSTDVAGQATATYLQSVLKPKDVTVTRIAYGVPVGTSLQFADEVTLAKALEGRRGVDA
ncbi:MAG: recombination protein RecR [Clostridia bacterium]|nr:recombination protein RecR [Clostridia bacterium]